MNNEEYLKDFLNADSAYERFKTFSAVLDWLDTKAELIEAKNAEIEQLRNAVPGYDLSEYTEEYANHSYGDTSVSGKIACLDAMIEYCRKQQIVTNDKRYWLGQEDTLQLIKQDVYRSK